MPVCRRRHADAAQEGCHEKIFASADFSHSPVAANMTSAFEPSRAHAEMKASLDCDGAREGRCVAIAVGKKDANDVLQALLHMSSRLPEMLVPAVALLGISCGATCSLLSAAVLLLTA